MVYNAYISNDQEFKPIYYATEIVCTKLDTKYEKVYIENLGLNIENT